jgi:hypothetical protein
MDKLMNMEPYLSKHQFQEYDKLFTQNIYKIDKRGPSMPLLDQTTLTHGVKKIVCLLIQAIKFLHNKR